MEAALLVDTGRSALALLLCSLFWHGAGKGMVGVRIGYRLS
jgi:hypothetical protein